MRKIIAVLLTAAAAAAAAPLSAQTVPTVSPGQVPTLGGPIPVDSAVTIAIAREQGYQVHALSVAYGQRHNSELAASERVSEMLGAAERVLAPAAHAADLLAGERCAEHVLAHQILLGGVHVGFRLDILARSRSTSMVRLLVMCARGVAASQR